MTDMRRDAVIRTALSPSDDVRPPVGMADEIHRRLLATPQQAASPWARMPGLRWMLRDTPTQEFIESGESWGYAAAPVIAGDIVYAADLDGKVRAIRRPR